MPPLNFVDATDLVAWSDRREAQDRLPEVVRRLVVRTAASKSRVAFRSGEGVQLAGWDGVVQAGAATAFVPEGCSVWELGVGQDPKGKADLDYDKRTATPDGIVPSTTTFIFVTSRRWSNKEQWASEHRAMGVWRDVRAYDADDLATWLALAPAVHAWISSLLRKHPVGAEDIGTWWESWSNVTCPPTSAAFLLAGREQDAQAVRNWLAGPPGVVVIKGDTADEAVAFLAAAVLEAPADDRERWLSGLMTVTDPEAWAQLSLSQHPLFLVPRFADHSRVASATARGHHVVIAVGRSESEPRGTVVLPRRRRKDVGAALAAMGVPEGRLDELSALARGSLGAVRRALVPNRLLLLPPWASPAEGRELLPALLAGRWDDCCTSSNSERGRRGGRPGLT